MVSKNLVRSASNGALYGLLCGLMVWALLLVQVSRTIHVSHTANKVVQFGPLAINTLSKQALPGAGYRIGIKVGPDAVAYIALWALGGASVGFVRSRRHKS